MIRHSCEKCKGTNGIYIKICEYTGMPIETYQEQYERTIKEYKLDKNFVKHSIGDEH